ncbi:MAG: DNA primase [Methanopyri archaeon]|nr:DNA primase [Methanopyri archaeon]
MKYVIKAKFKADGYVERPDVVGAVFGQTEGLLGEELDLRRLLKTGRIGRIDVKLRRNKGKTEGYIIVPSSLDRVETALVAAALEEIDRVGPCPAEVEVVKIEDIRKEKRKRIVERAKELLRTMITEVTPDSSELVKEVKKAIEEEPEISEYKGLPAGPDVEEADEVIVVEGRADVLNLLKYGITNVVAVEGTSVPDEIAELSKDKKIVAFVDGDRGGELILKELMEVADVDYVARAPEGKEVEELTRKEIMEALERKAPAEKVMEELSGKKPKRPKPERKPAPKTDETAKRLLDRLKEIEGTFKAELLDEDFKPVKKVDVDEVVKAVGEAEDGVKAVVVDGVVTERLAKAASESGLEYVVGVKKGDIEPDVEDSVRIITLS